MSKTLDPTARALAVLRLPPTATAEEIKERFRQEAKRWHPDRHHRDAAGAREAADRFRIVREAHDFLLAQERLASTNLSEQGGGRGQLERDELEAIVAGIDAGYPSLVSQLRLVEAFAGASLAAASFVHYKPFVPLVFYLPIAIIALPNRAARCVGWCLVALHAVGLPLLASKTGWPVLACAPDCWLVGR